MLGAVDHFEPLAARLTEGPFHPAGPPSPVFVAVPQRVHRFAGPVGPRSCASKLPTLRIVSSSIAASSAGPNTQFDRMSRSFGTRLG